MSSLFSIVTVSHCALIPLFSDIRSYLQDIEDLMEDTYVSLCCAQTRHKPWGGKPSAFHFRSLETASPLSLICWMPTPSTLNMAALVSFALSTQKHW